MGISSAAGIISLKAGNCSQGAARSNLRNSCANSTGSCKVKQSDKEDKSKIHNRGNLSIVLKHPPEQLDGARRHTGTLYSQTGGNPFSKDALQTCSTSTFMVIGLQQTRNRWGCAAGQGGWWNRCRTCPKPPSHSSLQPIWSKLRKLY